MNRLTAALAGVDDLLAEVDEETITETLHRGLHPEWRDPSALACDWCGHLFHGLPCDPVQSEEYGVTHWDAECGCESSRTRFDDTWRPFLWYSWQTAMTRHMAGSGLDGWASEAEMTRMWLNAPPLMQPVLPEDAPALVVDTFTERLRIEREARFTAPGRRIEIGDGADVSFHQGELPRVVEVWVSTVGAEPPEQVDLSRVGEETGWVNLGMIDADDGVTFTREVEAGDEPAFPSWRSDRVTITRRGMERFGPDGELQTAIDAPPRPNVQAVMEAGVEVTWAGHADAMRSRPPGEAYVEVRPGFTLFAASLAHLDQRVADVAAAVDEDDDDEDDEDDAP